MVYISLTALKSWIGSVPSSRITTAGYGMHRLSRTIVFLTCSLTAALPVHAQPVYKCTKAGKTIFQQVPCEGADIARINAPAPAPVPVPAPVPAPAPASGGLPWDGLHSGMSSQDVLRIAAGAQPEGERLLRRQGIVVAGVRFDAEYHFDAQGRLQAVFADKADGTQVGVLNLNGNEANQSDFERLATAFRAKYGTETGRSLKSKETGFPGLSASADWSADGAKIFISASPVTATTSMLRIGANPVGQR
jgi:hypothetical protein